MRIAYLDEAGIGGISQEPLVVVGGVIVHAEEQLIALESRLRQVVERHVPEGEREGFFLHGKDLLHGGKAMPQERWEKERRWKIIDELVLIPRDFKLPVIFSWVDLKALQARRPQLSVQELTMSAQTVASMNCVCGIERFLRERTPANELGIVVYENNDNARKAVRDMHNYIRDPQLVVGEVVNPMAQILPLQRIVETAHFAEKADSSILQLADICTMVIKRRMMCKPESKRFIQPIYERLIVDPVGGWPQLPTQPV